MPKGKPKQNKQTLQANGAGISKMEAVRRALAELGKDAMPIPIKEYLQSRFGIEMNTEHISNYKSSLLKASGAKKKPGPKPKRVAAKSKGEGSVDL